MLVKAACSQEISQLPVLFGSSTRRTRQHRFIGRPKVTVVPRAECIRRCLRVSLLRLRLVQWVSLLQRLSLLLKFQRLTQVQRVVLLLGFQRLTLVEWVAWVQPRVVLLQLLVSSKPCLAIQSVLKVCLCLSLCNQWLLMLLGKAHTKGVLLILMESSIALRLVARCSHGRGSDWWLVVIALHHVLRHCGNCSSHEACLRGWPMTRRLASSWETHG